MKRVVGFVVILAFFGGLGCAQEPVKHRYHSGTISNDLFPVEQGMPIREVKKNQDFFFKKCEAGPSSRPYFTRTEYQCSDVR